MQRRRRLLVVALSAALILLAAALLALAAGAGRADVIQAGEALLDPGGLAYDISRGAQGDLWISDDAAGQIWQVHPPTGAYTVYHGLSHPGAAQAGAAGEAWWTDGGLEPKLGRLSPAAGTLTTWALPAAGQLWGLAIDEHGQVWTSDLGGRAYSFTPRSHQLCAYPLPDAGASDRILAADGAVWLGDHANARILRLDPAAKEFTVWQLPAGAYPAGLALDAGGGLWWTDKGRGELGRLEPQAGRLAAYALPAGASPETISLDRGQAWYTESAGRTLGALEPGLAQARTAVVEPVTQPVTPDCRPLGAGTTTPVAMTRGVLAWSPRAYTQTVDGGGWRVYQLPALAAPWGLAAGPEALWAVDQGRRRLVRVPVPERGLQFSTLGLR